MVAIVRGPSTNGTAEMRIVGISTEKTRRTLGSYTAYQVYFELSGNPPLAWSEIFAREWKDINPMQEAGLDGRYLVIHCPLEMIATTHLPALKKAVNATNVAYKQYCREQARAEDRQGDAWRQEQEIVEDMARTLEFE